MPEIELHPTDEFFEQCSLLHEEAEALALKSLGWALIRLKSSRWGSLPIKPHGSSGRTFSFSFYPPYNLIFDRVTDRDEKKRPVKIHLWLKRIERS